MAKKPTGPAAGVEQLKSDLKAKTPGRFYILYGEEDYLRRYYLEQLKKQVLDDLTADFNFHRLNAENFSVELLADCIEALPMMAERTLILAEDVDLFAQAETERLCELLTDLPDYCCLVLTYEDFKPDKRSGSSGTRWRRTRCSRSSAIRRRAICALGSTGISPMKRSRSRPSCASICCSSAACP